LAACVIQAQLPYFVLHKLPTNELFEHFDPNKLSNQLKHPSEQIDNLMALNLAIVVEILQYELANQPPKSIIESIVKL
jgi:hypothetical protein